MDTGELTTAVVGFEFTGDPLLQGEFVPLRQGLTVLYGLNGAGKTRLLRGVRAALTGVADDVEVGMIVRLERPAVDDRPSREPMSASALLVALAEAIGALDAFAGIERPVSPFWDPVPLSPLAASVVVDGYILRHAGYHDPDLTAEISDSRLFLLMPTGVAGNPSWDAWGVADLELPAATRVRTVLQGLYDKWMEAGDDEFDSALDEWDEQARPHPLYWPAENNVFRAAGRLRRVTPSHYSPYDCQYADGGFLSALRLRGGIDFGLDVLDLTRDASDATESYLGSIVATLGEQVDFDGLEVSAGLLGPREPITNLQGAVAAHGGLASATSTDWASAREEDARFDSLVEQTLVAVAGDLTRRVNDALRAALPEPPSAALSIRPAQLRFAGRPADWSFEAGTEVSHAGRIGLEDLSGAERFWANRAIHEALYWHRRETLASVDPLRPLVELIDEPESGLHRAAESQMAAALVAQSVDPRRVIIAATHSPELLDSFRSHVLEVQRRGAATISYSRSTVSPLDLAGREALGRLGLTPSDLLWFHRVILLVEGEHDQTLLDAFLGARLRAARVKVVPLHGGARLADTVDSGVLFDHTRAHLVALIDNLRSDEVRRVWDRAVEAAVRGDAAAAETIVLDGIPRQEGLWKADHAEAGFIRTWMTSGLRKGVYGRLTPTSLSAADIVEYLPVTRFVPGAESWDALRAEHAEARRTHRDKTASDFKKWLGIAKGAEFNSPALRAAAEALPIPREFADLMDMLEAISDEDGRGQFSLFP